MVAGRRRRDIGALLAGAALGACNASQLNNLMRHRRVSGWRCVARGDRAVTGDRYRSGSVKIALLSTLYRYWRAAATQPAEALRYE